MDYLIVRGICSFLSGTLISQSGSFIQLGTRNILASPSTLGLDGLAVLWLLVFHSAVIALSTSSSSLMLLLLGLPFFVGIGLLFSSLLKANLKFEKVILLGVTFNLLVGAVFSLWQFFFMAFNLPFPVELWFGHFRFSMPEHALYLFMVEAFILLGLFLQWKELMLFSLGQGLCRHYGLKEKNLFSFLFVSVAVGTFVVVSLFGALAFLGLIFPLFARKIWFKKYDLKGEILLGSGMNGVFLMVIDLFCYAFPFWGAEIPVGLIVTAIGAAGLILLLWKSGPRESLAKSDK